jgi:hypothetical protein
MEKDIEVLQNFKIELSNMVEYSEHMYVNRKIRPVETIPGMGESG